jgi:nicotinate-nucleotide--dimethylbenzimidazole phosphoribosyltransferase
VIPSPSRAVREQTLEEFAALAQPYGALGRLEELGAWVAACQGACPPRPLGRVRLVVLAGDHGVAHHGVSAYPATVTPVMVRAFVAGSAGVNVLARQHDVAVRVLDIAVDAGLSDLPAPVTAYKMQRSSGPIHLVDALSTKQVERGLEVGRIVAEEEIAAGADLLVLGDMGIGNSTPAAALIAATFGVGADQVTGRGTGIGDAAFAAKTALITSALQRTSDRVSDPVERLAALGAADFAVGVGFLVAAARTGVPVLLDGVVSLAEACVAEDLAPGVLAWCAAGHRSTEPSQRLALEKLGLEPILDLGLRLGEGSGALTALPVLRSAVLLVREMARLRDLVPIP